MKAHKQFSLVLTALLCCSSIFAAEKNEIKLGIEGGYTGGNIYENLFYTPSNNTEFLKSMLDWQVHSPVVSLTAETLFKNNLYFKFKPTASIPGKSGIMQDYDWLNYETYGTTELSRYSAHENNLNYYFNLTFDAGYSFEINNKLRITPFLRANYENIFFTSYNGFIQYPIPVDGKEIWSPETSKEPVSGAVISYNQNIQSLGLGLKTQILPVKKFQLNTELCILPLINYYSYDLHIKRNSAFGDEIKTGLILNYGTEAIYKISEHNHINLSFSGILMPYSKGNTYDAYAKEWKGWKNWFIETSYMGGTKRILFNASLGYQYCF